MRIFGIDPGSRITGFGCIDVVDRNISYVASGTIKVSHHRFPLNLKFLFLHTRELMEKYHPDECAIEQVFVAKNPSSAIKLGQARGALLCAMMMQSTQVAEYAARSIKQAVVGNGGASKQQVQFMVQAILNLPKQSQPDAADALAIAICHAHVRNAATAK